MAGARLPHVWLNNGTALHDQLGAGYSLLRLGNTKVNTTNLECAMRETGAPLDVLDVASEAARDIYGYDLLLVRPDLHVAWRGNQFSEHAEEIAVTVTGQA